MSDQSPDDPRPDAPKPSAPPPSGSGAAGGPPPGSGDDTTEPRPGPADEAIDVIERYVRPGRENVMAVYVLYLAGFVPALGIVPIIIGFVLAVRNRGAADDTWNSHYDFQVRQGILALIALAVSIALVFVLIGFLGLLALAIWWILRSVMGLIAASRGERIRDPETYTW